MMTFVIMKDPGRMRNMHNLQVENVSQEVVERFCVDDGVVFLFVFVFLLWQYSWNSIVVKCCVVLAFANAEHCIKDSSSAFFALQSDLKIVLI